MRVLPEFVGKCLKDVLPPLVALNHFRSTLGGCPTIIRQLTENSSHCHIAHRKEVSTIVYKNLQREPKVSNKHSSLGTLCEIILRAGFSLRNGAFTPLGRKRVSFSFFFRASKAAEKCVEGANSRGLLGCCYRV
jgi:hypothetical protein